MIIWKCVTLCLCKNVRELIFLVINNALKSYVRKLRTKIMQTGQQFQVSIGQLCQLCKKKRTRGMKKFVIITSKSYGRITLELCQEVALGSRLVIT